MHLTYKETSLYAQRHANPTCIQTNERHWQAGINIRPDGIMSCDESGSRHPLNKLKNDQECSQYSKTKSQTTSTRRVENSIPPRNSIVHITSGFTYNFYTVSLLNLSRVMMMWVMWVCGKVFSWIDTNQYSCQNNALLENMSSSYTSVKHAMEYEVYKQKSFISDQLGRGTISLV